MEELRSPIILTCISLYMILCVVIGIWALRKTKTVSHFFMANKELGVMVTAFAVFSTTLSGFGFVGGPGLVYQMGMSSFWMVIVAIMGFNVSFSLLAKRLRLFAELGSFISLPDVVYRRYGSNQTRALMAFAIVLGVVGYLATQILAMAVILKEILNNAQYFGVISLEISMIISCSILVFYSVTGGIIASVYTDVIQGGVMVVAAILIFITVVLTFDNGLMEITTTVYKDDPQAIGPWGTLGLLGSMSWLLLFGLGGSGQPHIITKLMMNKSVNDARYILPISILGYIFSALLWVGIGLAMRALVLQGIHEPLNSPDDAAGQFLQYYTHPILAGIVFAGLFAAIMSTADAFVNIGSAAIMHDLPKSFNLDLSRYDQLALARITTAGLSLVAAVFALYTGDLIAILGAFGWGTFAAAIVPVVTLGFNWKRATATAANVSIICSLVINLAFKLFSWKLPYNIDVGAFSLIFSLFIFVLISINTKPLILDPAVEKILDI